MPLTVIHSSLRIGYQRPENSYESVWFANYSLVNDGSLQAGDVVVYCRATMDQGGGSAWFAEWDGVSGPQALNTSPFSQTGGFPGDPPTGSIMADSNDFGHMYYTVVVPAHLVDPIGNPLLRFGWQKNASSDRFYGGAFGAWVLRAVSFNSVPAGSEAMKLDTFICPFDLTPAPGEGVLTASQMLFGMAYFQDGGPAANDLSITQNLGGFHELSTGRKWNNPFGSNSFGACSIWGGPGQDATGQTFTLDTVPTGGIVPDIGSVQSQAGSLLGLLDLTDVAPGVFAGFGFGGRFQDGG